MNANAKNARKVSVALERQVNAVLLATVLAKATREKMDAVYNRLLAEVEYFPAEHWCDKGLPRERITDRKSAYLMDDTDSEFYYAEGQQARDAMGYNLPDGHCPALIAENLQRDAEHLLIESAEEFFQGVTVNKLLCHGGLDGLRKYIDLLIGLVVNRPGYMAPELAPVA